MRRFLALVLPLLAAAPAGAYTILGCKPTGDGGDPAVNAQKSRYEWPPGGKFKFVDLKTTKTMNQPSKGGPCAGKAPGGSTPQKRAAWTSGFRGCIEKEEEQFICVRGVVTKYRKQSAESVNCKNTVPDKRLRDYHVWLAPAGSPKKTAAKNTWVVEITPRFQINYGWTDADLKQLTQAKEVLVFGQKMFDQWHTSVAHRKSAWEVHPVAAVWVDLGKGAGWEYLGGKSGKGAVWSGKEDPVCVGLK